MVSIGNHSSTTPAPAKSAPRPVVWPAPDANRHIGAPLAWGLALAAVATVFAIIAIIANYGPLNRASKEHLVAVELPASRYDAVRALITATGEACSKVCSIRPEPNLSGPVHLNVTCARRSSPTSCAAPVRYTIAVSRQD